MPLKRISRRDFIGTTTLGAAAWPLSASLGNNKKPGEKPFRLSIFSKYLQWLDYDKMTQTAAEVGFDGLELTVRKKGHVLPERVEEDLPRVVEAARKAGIEVISIATQIADPNHPDTEKTIATASRLGIQYYRMAYCHYSRDKSINATLDELKPKFRDLAEMNKQYGIHGAYQNHAGSKFVGAVIWDLWELIKDLDPRYMGCQFDIRHAAVEAGLSWPTQLRLMASYIKTLVVKDFYWRKGTKGWQPVNCPLGEGAVDLVAYLQLLKNESISGPISLHYQYDLGGANRGRTELTMPAKQVVGAIKRDVEFFKHLLVEKNI